MPGGSRESFACRRSISAGDREHALDRVAEVLAGRVRVAGVEAEAERRRRSRRRRSRPRASPGRRSGGRRRCRRRRCSRSGPGPRSRASRACAASGRRPRRCRPRRGRRARSPPSAPMLGRGVAGLLEDLARAVADVVARRADVDQVGRVDVDADRESRSSAALGLGRRLLPALRLGEEDLDAVGSELRARSPSGSRRSMWAPIGGCLRGAIRFKASLWLPAPLHSLRHDQAGPDPRLDRLDRRAGARRRRAAPTSSSWPGFPPPASWERLVAQAREHGVAGSSRSTAAGRRRGGRADARRHGRVLAGAEGVRELSPPAERRPRAERDRRDGGPRPHDRRAHRGHRRSRSPTRRASWSAASWSRRSPRRRAPGSCPSTPSTPRSSSSCGGGGTGAVDRLVLTASGGPFRGRTDLDGVTPRGGARAPDLGDGGQDHDRLGDPDEQGLRGDRGPPPVRRRLRARSTSSSTRSRSSTRSSSSTTAPRSPTWAFPTCGCRSPTRSTIPSAPTSPCRRSTSPRSASSPSSSPTSMPSPACGSPARPARPAAPRPASLNAADEVAVAAFLDGADPVHRHRGGRRGHPRGDAGATPLAHFEDLFAADARGARARRRAGSSEPGLAAHELGPRLRRLRRC